MRSISIAARGLGASELTPWVLLGGFGLVVGLFGYFLYEAFKDLIR